MFSASGETVPTSSDLHLRQEDLGDAVPIDPTAMSRRRVQIHLGDFSSSDESHRESGMEGLEERRVESDRNGVVEGRG